MASWKKFAESAQEVCDLCAKNGNRGKLAQFYVKLEEQFHPAPIKIVCLFQFWEYFSLSCNRGSKQTSFPIKDISGSVSSERQVDVEEVMKEKTRKK